MASLWATEGAFRLITLVYSLFIHTTAVGHYTRPLTATAFIVGQCAWSTFVAWALVVWPARRNALVAADVVVTVALIASTWLVAPESWWDHNQSLPTTMWATNAVLCPGMQWGVSAGFGIAVLVGLASLTMGGDLGWMERSPTLPILVSAGMAAGVGGRTVRRSHEQLTAALELRARSVERERLAREVHDGVLQALALMARKGPEIGGEAVALGELAGQQERALRKLIAERDEAAETPADVGLGVARDGGTVVQTDLRAALLELADERVTVSAGSDAVHLRDDRAREIVAAVRQALVNTERHAGERARSFILLEVVADDVVVSVRDDGCGIAPGRLAEAEADGRMGVSRSIRGRIEAIGGEVTLDSAPGQGTEWEFVIPR